VGGRIRQVRRRALSLAALVGTVNAACQAYRPEPDFTAPTLATPVAIEGTPLTQIWSRHAVRGPSGPLAVDTLCLYIGGSDRRVAAVDLATGKNRWVTHMEGPLTAGILRAGHTVYAATDQPGGNVHAMNPISGDGFWTTGVGYVDVPLTIVDGVLYALNRDGVLLALDPETGKIHWHERVGRGRIPPIEADSAHLLVMTTDSLFLLLKKTGAVTARRRAPGAVVAPWVEHGAEVLVATSDSGIVAVMRESLDVLWHLRVDAPVLSAPVLRDDTLFVVTRIGSVYRVKLGDNPELEQLVALDRPITGSPALAGDWLLIGGANGDLLALTSDGTEAWHVPVGRPVEIAPLLLNDSTLFSIGGQGQLSRYRL
jgi:outer membrane protein assembly factor BamB